MTISGSNQSVVLAVPLPAASGGTGATSFPSPGTAGNVLTSNGTAWTSAVAAGFPTGTVLIFGQTSAPTGWTKDTTNFNDSALRVVTGSVSSGGTQGFTTAFASQAVSGSIANTTAAGTVGSYTLTSADIPSHQHEIMPKLGGSNQGFGAFLQGATSAGGNSNNTTTGLTGGGGGHSHSFTGTAHNHTFTGTAINLAVKYVDVIRATKD
jgi:hypothetical protein